MLKKIVIVLILVTWPLSLFLANTSSNFSGYILPAVLIFVSYLLYIKNYKFFFVPLFIVPFVEPKLALVPFLFLLFTFKRKNLFFLICSFLLALLFIRPFFGQSILTYDYQATQQILQKEKLYNSVVLARIFQNKPRIIASKFTTNLFVLTDPNNYFFGFAPGQIKVDNQNLQKFPFLSLPFLLIAIYYLFSKENNAKYVVPIFFALLLNLSLLTNFDRNDFVLYVPISLLIFSGLNIFEEKFKYKHIYELIMVVFALAEVIRIVVAK